MNVTFSDDTPGVPKDESQCVYQKDVSPICWILYENESLGTCRCFTCKSVEFFQRLFWLWGFQHCGDIWIPLGFLNMKVIEAMKEISLGWLNFNKAEFILADMRIWWFSRISIFLHQEISWSAAWGRSHLSQYSVKLWIFRIGRKISILEGGLFSFSRHFISSFRFWLNWPSPCWKGLDSNEIWESPTSLYFVNDNLNFSTFFLVLGLIDPEKSSHQLIKRQNIYMNMFSVKWRCKKCH
jgi:hypothetical protein